MASFLRRMSSGTTTSGEVTMDDKSPSCKGCAKEFGMLFGRRVNCVNCGGAFCGNCASTKHRINSLNVKSPSNTCPDCHKILCKELQAYLATEEFQKVCFDFSSKYGSSAASKANELYGSLNLSEGPMPSKDWQQIMTACGSHLTVSKTEEDVAEISDQKKFANFCEAAFAARVQMLLGDGDFGFGITGF